MNWGDGTTPDVLSGSATRPTVYHDYEGAGTYLIQVTATDTAGSPTTHTYDAMLENDVAGELEQQFASSGTTPGSVGGNPGSYSGVAVQPDGSIVAVNPDSTTNPIVRYDDTGTPDGTTFDDISSAQFRASPPWPSSPRRAVSTSWSVEAGSQAAASIAWPATTRTAASICRLRSGGIATQLRR